MDYTTLIYAYAGILLTVAGALVIIWRQNPLEVGPRSWAIGSIVGALALFGFVLAGAHPSRWWLGVSSNLMSWLGVLYYARGTRQFAGRQATPAWLVAAFALAALASAVAAVATPYGAGAAIISRSFFFALCCFDIVATVLRDARTRNLPGYFLALFFGLFGGTNAVRFLLTAVDYGETVYQRPVDLALLFIGILGGAGTAMGFSMLTTAQLMAERALHLRTLESGVDHLRELFVGLAQGNYGVRAKATGGDEPMAVIGSLFNDTVVQVERAFGEVDLQRNLLAATQESMLDGLLFVDSELRVQIANPAMGQLLGRETSELRDRPLETLLAAQDRSFASEILDAVKHAPIRGRETRFARSDGQALTLTVNASAHRDVAGQLQGVVLVVRDDRALREAQAQLQMSDRLAAMGTVAAGVAHEINNPLAYVMANIDFVLEELESLQKAGRPLSREDALEYLKALRAAQEGSERVRKIVLDLKSFSRRRDDEEGPVDVNQLVESAAAMLENEIRHHARLELALEPVPAVMGAEAKLGQVFLNLIQNAAQAIPTGHASDNLVRVSSTSDDRGVVIEVSDTGSGISEDNLQRIFDAFFTTKPVGVGTGLGLALCHREVSALGGRIEVSSEVGKGALFRIVLPPARNDATATSGPDAVEAVEPERGRRRVLFVDDEVEVGRSAQRILGRDHEVKAVTSALDALELVAEESFDIILCDLMMPAMTGMEFFAELERRQPELCSRVVFMSGGVFSPDAQEFVRRHPHIGKPLSTKTLRDVVARGALADG